MNYGGRMNQQHGGNEFASDRVMRIHYTSFEPNKHRSNYMANISMKPAKDQLVAMKDITISPDNAITFYGRSQYLSNYFEAPMVIAGHMYPTVEHYYQACKVYALCGPHEAVNMKGIRDAGQIKDAAKRILSQYHKSKKEQEQWKMTDGLLVVRVGVVEKFRQSPPLRERFFATGEKLLIQANKYDELWAAGMEFKQMKDWLGEHKGETFKYPALIESNTLDKVPIIGKGKNLLGFLLMYVRQCLRTEFGMPVVETSMATLSINGKTSEKTSDEGEENAEKLKDDDQGKDKPGETESSTDTSGTDDSKEKKEKDKKKKGTKKK